MASEGVVVLPGWETSRGASLEVWIAIDLDMPIYEYGGADDTSTLERIEGLRPSPLPFGGERTRTREEPPGGPLKDAASQR